MPHDNSKLFRMKALQHATESETLFFFRIVEATLEFQKDASGAVTAVRLRQGPFNELGPRK